MARKNRRSKSTIDVLFAGARIRRISRAEYESLRDRGRALPIHDKCGQLLGCQLTNNHPGDGLIPSQPGGAAISAREMQLYAFRSFRDGKSRTAGLTETQRLERSKQTSTRTGKYLVPEDAVERVAEKVRLQTMSANFHDGGKDRAVRVYPRGEK